MYTIHIMITEHYLDDKDTLFDYHVSHYLGNSEEL